MLRYSILATLALCLISATALAEPPSNGYIGVFGDAAGTDCCFDLNATGNGKLHVYMVTGGATSAGISGAEYKVSIEPPALDAVVHWTPAPDANVSVGNPVDNGDGGGNFTTFKSCQSSTGLAGDKIFLGSLHVINLTGEHKLVVRKHDSPINTAFDCPSVLLCDGPVFTQVCLTLKSGDPALAGDEPAAFVSAVNSPDCADTSCGFVATENQTWTSVKGLFR